MLKILPAELHQALFNNPFPLTVHLHAMHLNGANPEQPKLLNFWLQVLQLINFLKNSEIWFTSLFEEARSHFGNKSYSKNIDATKVLFKTTTGTLSSPDKLQN